MHEKEDQFALWNSYLKGDAYAFEKLYNTYYDKLTNYGFRFTDDSQYVEYAIQDLFTKLWKNKNRIGQVTLVKNYLYVSFRRILIRKLGQAKDVLPFDDNTAEQHFEFTLSPESNLISKERLLGIQSKLNGALSNMNARQREIIFLKYYEDMSYDQIADVMGITVKGTYKLLYRAIEALRSQLGNFTLLLIYWIITNMKK